MSADGSVTIPARVLTWGNDDYKFRLAVGELRELQETINKPRIAMGAPPIGPRTLCRLLETGDAWLDEVREPIRLGLIGAGMEPVKALALVRRYVDARPLQESIPIAHAIVATALIGVPDDPVGKKPEAGEIETATTESSSPQSTEPAAPSDSAPSKSTDAPSGSSPRPSTAMRLRMARKRR